MPISYLVTTRLEKIRGDLQIIMLDGTVPGWTPKKDDFHFDHHRRGGAAIQIDEMPYSLSIKDDAIIVTTQVDADACVAAAFAQLNWGKRSHLSVSDTLSKLRAIAFDCDHLCVPPELLAKADFAACAVAALKLSGNSLVDELGLPRDRKTWSLDDKERYSSEAFKRGTDWLIDASYGNRPFPGELGEATEYWQQVEHNTQMLIEQKRLKLYCDCLLIDYRGLGGQYIDPRCAIKATAHWDIPLPITLSVREVYIEGELFGYSYTLGTIPLHPLIDKLDYTLGIFERLTHAERAIQPNADGWGGRKTVGGSGWNTPSHLTPQQVVDIVLEHYLYL